MTQKRLLKPTLSTNLTEATVKTITDALDAGVSIDDIINDDAPQFRGQKELSDESLNELVSLRSQGSAIPGQSLTTDPEAPYPWEQPPKFANPREALQDILASILTPDAVEHILASLVKGTAVSDLAMVILYSKYMEGSFNVDSMLLLAEPLMYMIMAIAEEANVAYNIEDGDLDEEDPEEIDSKIQELNTAFESIKQGVNPETITKDKLQTGALPQNLLDKIKEKGPEIRESLLSKGDE